MVWSLAKQRKYVTYQPTNVNPYLDCQKNTNLICIWFRGKVAGKSVLGMKVLTNIIPMLKDKLRITLTANLRSQSSLIHEHVTR